MTTLIGMGKDKLKRLSPTDISQFIRLEQCERYLRLRLHEKSINRNFMLEYEVATQAIPPLLTLSGGDFEVQVETEVAQRFSKLNFASDKGGRPKGVNNNEQVASIAQSLQANEVIVLFQSRLHLDVAGWQFTGDIDLIRLARDHNGLLNTLIVDMKSSTSVKGRLEE